MALIKNKINVLKKIEINRQNQDFVRINGWTLPFHWLQIIAWTFYLLMSLICFTLIVPTLPTTQLRCIVLAIKVLLFIVQFITHVIAVNINPADDNVAEKLGKITERPKFDRTKHRHVIENQFCYICETTVGSKSKHCSVCNKCVSDFDHHCKWLNNCVGGKNYRWFIYTVLSALLGSLSIFINCLILTIAYFSLDSWLWVKDPNPTLLFFNSQSDLNCCYKGLQIFWIVVIISSLILSSIAVILLSHLLGFHLFLNFAGLSTYEFVIQQRTDKSYISGLLNGSERNKLYSYLKQIQNCFGITICTKKRIKPLDPDLNDFIESKLSNDKEFIKSVVKEITNEDLKEISDNIKKDIKSNENSKPEKDIEINSNELNARNDTKGVSLEKSDNNQSISHLNELNDKKSSNILPQINESNKTYENKKTVFDLNKVLEEESTEENETIVDQNVVNVWPKITQRFSAENEPIFKPLNHSFGQNGRTSRLSFVPSVSPEVGLSAVPSKRLFIRYNSYRNQNQIKSYNELNNRLEMITKNTN